MRLHKFCRFMADIEVHAISPETLHLMVNGTRHDIPRSQFSTRVEVWHETATIRAAQIGAFSAQSFGQQKITCLWMVQTSRMELVKFHVGHAAACTPRHSDAITGGNIWIGGVLIYLGRTASGQDHRFRTDGFDSLQLTVPNIGAQHPIGLLRAIGQFQFSGCDQINSVVAFVQLDVRV